MNKRLHVIYSGDVQGVGFRFTAERAAMSLGLTGWVKNLSDGRVEVVCEAESPELNEFLEKVGKVFKESINSRDVKWEEATGEFAGFDIRF
jgi:acylphosphatase